MAVFRRFSAAGRKGIIERRDCLFNPNAEIGTSYLKKKDLLGPAFKRLGPPTAEEKNRNILEIHF